MITEIEKQKIVFFLSLFLSVIYLSQEQHKSQHR